MVRVGIWNATGDVISWKVAMKVNSSLSGSKCVIFVDSCLSSGERLSILYIDLAYPRIYILSWPRLHRLNGTSVSRTTAEKILIAYRAAAAQ